MAKDAYYFSHDSNARNDLKIVKLRRLIGLEGYGLYWCVIEMLRESERYELPIRDIKDICFELRIDEKNFDILFECELICKGKKTFFSKSLKKRMLRLDSIKQKRKIAGAKGGKSKASAKQLLSKSEASKVKESKVNEIKEKNIIPPPLDLIFSYSKSRGNNVDVNKFFNFYESKNWMIGKNKMKDWQAAYRTWEPQIKPKAKTPF